MTDLDAVRAAAPNARIQRRSFTRRWFDTALFSFSAQSRNCIWVWPLHHRDRQAALGSLGRPVDARSRFCSGILSLAQSVSYMLYLSCSTWPCSRYTFPSINSVDGDGSMIAEFQRTLRDYGLLVIFFIIFAFRCSSRIKSQDPTL
jgi:hypothetical protein